MTSAEFTAKLRSIIIQRGAQDKILNAIENEPSMSPATFNNFMKKKSSRVTMVQAMFYLSFFFVFYILPKRNYRGEGCGNLGYKKQRKRTNKFIHS